MKKVRIPKILKNKYVIILLVFVVWVGFLDRNNMIATMQNKKKLQKLEEELEYYKKEIRETQKSLKNLRTNDRSFEKFARENFYLKRDGEEIFVVDEDKLK
jgi:cell division protein DivIC